VIKKGSGKRSSSAEDLSGGEKFQVRKGSRRSLAEEGHRGRQMVRKSAGLAVSCPDIGLHKL